MSASDFKGRVLTWFFLFGLVCGLPSVVRDCACGRPLAAPSPISFPQTQPAQTRPARDAESAANFVGNSESGIYHHSNCSTIRRLDPFKAVMFASEAEAEAAGYRPCKRCR